MRALAEHSGVGELTSAHGQEWTPVHNERFFRENMDRFGDDNYALVRMLLGNLDSQDDLTVEVACYDLGEFARFHADGRRYGPNSCTLAAPSDECARCPAR